MKNRTIPMLIAGVGGILAAIGLSRGGVAPSQDAESGPSVEIFVSVRTIDVAEPITPDKLRLEKWPVDRIPEGASSHLADFEGKFARQRFYAGEPIMSVKLIGEIADATQAIPHGYRIVSLPTGAQRGIIHPIRPGDRVDVLAYFKESDRFTEPTAKTVLTGVRVFAIEDASDHDEGVAREKTKETHSISLLIRRHDAPAWTCARELGTIHLALASPTEMDDRVDDSAASPTAEEFLAWLSNHHPVRNIHEGELLQTAATSTVPTLVSVPAPVELSVPTEPAPPVTVPTAISSLTKKPKPGFKMLKMSGGVQTEYWVAEGSQVPVIMHPSDDETMFD